MKLFTSVHSIKWCLVACLCLLAQLPAVAQLIKNVRTSVDQSKQVMIIRYDLTGLHFKKEIKVVPYIIGSDSLASPIKSLSGDFGWVSQSGKNKEIVWDFFKDGVTSLQDIQIDIKSETRDATLPRFWGVALQGSNSAPFGVKGMQLGRLGFFASARFGKFPRSHEYMVSNAGVIDYPELGVYIIGTEKRLASYAIIAGPVFQMGRKIYGYLGAGYGAEQLYWKYKEYDLNNILLGGNWALNESINEKGLAVDTGLVIRLGRVLIDLGLNTINFKSVQIIGGLGLTFSNSKKL